MDACFVERDWEETFSHASGNACAAPTPEGHSCPPTGGDSRCAARQWGRPSNASRKQALIAAGNKASCLGLMSLHSILERSVRRVMQHGCTCLGFADSTNPVKVRQRCESLLAFFLHPGD